ncbi:MAG: cellulose biosynthesis protein CelD [Candidatus Omnitrophica bacterium CG12_big_fil_rev_8_21_14_0_65_50_5]|nr:MAG: cellulose biosynthesis protein CelD [Candidatus Omnitrophica bacterium CG12_big_fil_rev_8_21_14_0_65_50_5]
MLIIRTESDLEACRKLWQQCIPSEKITDLWDVRECFHRFYRRELMFVVAEDGGEVVGLIPLAWISENGCYGYFPGEVWKGTTWLEQNRIIARDKDVLRRMLDWLHEKKYSCHLGYLNDHTTLELPAAVDEIGYLFLPPKYNFQMQTYHNEFSRKSIRAIEKIIADFKDLGLQYCDGNPDDVELMIEMNLNRFGESSYFSDERFAGGFRALRDFFHARGWLRMTVALVDNKPAAVDMGIVYNNAYTLLAGGTNGEFPGIAKAINMYHIRKACEEKYSEADFLCGDFFWKPMFHLTPRPLYLLSNEEKGTAPFIFPFQKK